MLIIVRAVSEYVKKRMGKEEEGMMKVLNCVKKFDFKLRRGREIS